MLLRVFTDRLCVSSFRSEVLGDSPQRVLLAYLEVLLTDWEDTGMCLERAATILPQILNPRSTQHLLADLLRTKVRIQYIGNNVGNVCLFTHPVCVFFVRFHHMTMRE